MNIKHHLGLRTLCLVAQGEQLLLGLKKRGFGAGRWNGFGGKLEAGETLLQAAARELHEEAGLILETAEPRARLQFTFTTGSDPLEVRVFWVTKWSGEPGETEEMRPQWFAFSALPYDHMWADDRHWLPQVLAGQSVEGQFHFENMDILSTHTVRTVAGMPTLRQA